MKRNFAVMAAACFLVATALQAREILPSDLKALPSVDVVFLGEVHDNPAHHEHQVAALLAIKPKAVVFEMLTAEIAKKVTPELLGNKDKLDAALDWANSGWPSFDMYFPVFVASAEAAIYGAQVPRDAAIAAAMGGDVAASFGARAQEFGLLEDLPAEQQAEREAMQLASHCNALPEEMLPGMVLAQRMRDAALARAATEALEATGGPVAVITGNGHARTDWGAAALMGEGVSVLSVGQFENAAEGPQPFDLWLVTEAAERDDPCAAFSK